MTQEISSLVDGEAQDAESAIRSCTTSEEHKQTWLAYHAIGDAMRGQAPRSLELPAGLIEALRAEPTVLAPKPRRAIDSTFTRIALAAAASVATVGVVGWLGTQGTQSAAPVIAKSGSAMQPVANKMAVRESAPDVQAYLAAHRQLPSAELYRPVNNRAPAPAR